MEGIKHISFDLWLTLIRSNPEFKPLRTRLFIKQFGINKPEADVLAAFRYFDAVFNTINEKTGGNLTVNQMLYIILTQLGVDITQISGEAITGFYNEAEKLFYNYPPQPLDTQFTETLHSLNEQGITTSILSNTAFILGITLRKQMDDFGWAKYFSFQIYSDEIGASKPSAKAFNNVYKQASAIKEINREEILHIGDNPNADIKGAKMAGFATKLLHPENETISDLLTPFLCSHGLQNII
jgi:putative hydrolase of the HAD superfamily